MSSRVVSKLRYRNERGKALRKGHQVYMSPHPRQEKKGVKSNRNQCEAMEARVHHAPGTQPAIGKVAPEASHALG